MDGQLSVEDEVMKKYIGDFTFDDDEYSDWINYISIFFFASMTTTFGHAFQAVGPWIVGTKHPKPKACYNFNIQALWSLLE